MFEEKIKACREWFYGIQVLYADKLDISIAVDDSNEFVANIDSAHHLGQLCVSQPDFRPYDFVEFTILAMRQDSDQAPTFWYGDRAEDTVQDIINNLNRGLNILLEES